MPPALTRLRLRLLPVFHAYQSAMDVPSGPVDAATTPPLQAPDQPPLG